jgi:hypothetical protein
LYREAGYTGLFCARDDTDIYLVDPEGSRRRPRAEVPRFPTMDLAGRLNESRVQKLSLDDHQPDRNLDTGLGL